MTAAMPAPGEFRVLWGDGRVAPADAPGTVIELGDDEALAELDRLYAPPQGPWVRMNMLGTLNARAAGPDGTSDSISNRADRAILKRIRLASDAIIVGAETVRQETHMATGPRRLVIVTNSGDLTGHHISPAIAEARVTVICPRSAAATVERTMPGASVHHPPGERFGVDAVVEWCRANGLDRMVIEGGSGLIAQFLDAGLIDEVCLTQAPVFGDPDSPSLPGSTAPLRFRRALLAADDLGFVYSRLVAERSADGSDDARAGAN